MILYLSLCHITAAVAAAIYDRSPDTERCVKRGHLLLK